MSPWRVRNLGEDDLDQVVRIWEESRDTVREPAVSLAEVVSALRGRMPAVVAVVGDRVVGAAVSSVAQERAWVLRLAIARQWRRHGIGSAGVRPAWG
ncbi:GNAT family N-acetyltransferase [Streptomyces sp. NEAU-L66]|uniref:GNAT family N-acetyltransferase n=1 Tax=Streptomyces sp. NEAU-L66 TaxID=3390812 RepID=UPI0039C6D029